MRHIGIGTLLQKGLDHIVALSSLEHEASSTTKLNGQLNICHSKYLTFTQSLIPKGQENWTPQITIFASLNKNATSKRIRSHCGIIIPGARSLISRKAQPTAKVEPKTYPTPTWYLAYTKLEETRTLIQIRGKIIQELEVMIKVV